VFVTVAEQDVSQAAVKLLAEVTLVWVLFTDAAGVRLRSLSATSGRTHACSRWTRTPVPWSFADRLNPAARDQNCHLLGAWTA
jgi:hypothetical protein